MNKGKIVIVQCERCPCQFPHKIRSKRRLPLYCPECRMEVNREQQGAWRERNLLKLNDHILALGVEPVQTIAGVAQILNLSDRAVERIEKQAMMRLRNHPGLKVIWSEYREDIYERDRRTGIERNLTLDWDDLHTTLANGFDPSFYQQE